MSQRPSERRKQIAEERGSANAPPAYFLRIFVENFRCFGPKQPLDLSNGEERPAQWTVILGENGVGKTTLLQSLVALEPERADASHIYTRMAIAGTLELLDHFGEGVRTGNDDYRLEGVIAHGSTLSATNELMHKTRVEVSGGELSRGMTGLHQGVLGLKVFGYGANRRMAAGRISESHAVDPCASLFFEDVPLVNAEERLLQADYAAKGGQRKAGELRDHLREALSYLLPDDITLHIVSGEEPRFVPRVEAQTPYGRVRLHNLSLGYRSLIAWIFDLVSRMFERYPASINPLAEPAVVLVDEIDLHLHPSWQRTLMASLSNLFPNTQFIATAHSPLVVQAATDANIVVLRREGDHVVIDNNPTSVRNWRVDQILTSELFGLESARPPRLDALMAERTTILEKGRLTKKDEARLRALAKEIGDLPAGETPADIEAMDIIRRAAAALQQK